MSKPKLTPPFVPYDPTVKKNTPPFFTNGQRVKIFYLGNSALGCVTMASPNGHSLILSFPDDMLGGFAGMMPVFWDEHINAFIDLMVNEEVRIEAVP